jgi:hypothetical protein
MAMRKRSRTSVGPADAEHVTRPRPHDREQRERAAKDRALGREEARAVVRGALEREALAGLLERFAAVDAQRVAHSPQLAVRVDPERLHALNLVRD